VSIFAPVLASTILGVLGQLVLKIGMTRMGPQAIGNGRNFARLAWNIGTNPFVVGGLVAYGTGVFFWLVALSRAPLSYTYPFASLSYVLITLASFFLLKEKISLLRLAGILVICSGVLIVAVS
jgi:drug/metabolite transporter (DMT)-like permease